MNNCKITHKSFIVGKDGEESGRQDRLVCYPQNRKYAVADGVSNSFHPEVVAQSLCHHFATTDIPDTIIWSDYFRTHILPNVSKDWNEYVNQHLASLSGRILRHETINFNRWKYGASTFCGIEITNENILKYLVVGDSTLFIVGENKQLISYSTSKHKDSDQEWVDYSNSTYAIVSDGSFSGACCEGNIIIEPGFILLMTDGIANWFQEKTREGLHPEETLWNLEDNNQFLSLVESAHSEGFMDDDLTCIIIKVEQEKDDMETDKQSIQEHPDGQDILTPYIEPVNTEEKEENIEEQNKEEQIDVHVTEKCEDTDTKEILQDETENHQTRKNFFSYFFNRIKNIKSICKEQTTVPKC